MDLPITVFFGPKDIGTALISRIFQCMMLWDRRNMLGSLVERYSLPNIEVFSKGADDIEILAVL